MTKIIMIQSRFLVFIDNRLEVKNKPLIMKTRR
jgi:hypothetical protein